MAAYNRNRESFVHGRLQKMLQEQLVAEYESGHVKVDTEHERSDSRPPDAGRATAELVALFTTNSPAGSP